MPTLEVHQSTKHRHTSQNCSVLASFMSLGQEKVTRMCSVYEHYRADFGLPEFGILVLPVLMRLALVGAENLETDMRIRIEHEHD